jgi:hypothetical protein
MTSDNRQFCLTEVSDSQRNKPKYFDRLYQAIGDAKVQKWLFDFFKNPQLLEGWVPTVFPVTEALRANARASQPQEVLFALFLCEQHTGTKRLTVDELFDKYIAWHGQQRIQAKPFAKTHLSTFLNDKGLMKRVAVDERSMSSRFKRIDFEAWRQALVSASIITPQEALESFAVATAVEAAAAAAAISAQP